MRIHTTLLSVYSLTSHFNVIKRNYFWNKKNTKESEIKNVDSINNGSILFFIFTLLYN